MSTSEQSANLPIWIEYVRAIGAPFAAVIAAFVAGFYARQQAQTAKNKLKLDLFKDRLEVFNAVITVCSKNAMHEDGILTEAEIEKFYAANQKARFLFNGEIVDFLDEVNDVIRGMGRIDDELDQAKTWLEGLRSGATDRETDVVVREKKAEKQRKRIWLWDQKGRCQRLFQEYMSYGNWR